MRNSEGPLSVRLTCLLEGGDTVQCHAEVTFDREVEGCLIAKMEGKDGEGSEGSSRD